MVLVNERPQILVQYHNYVLSSVPKDAIQIRNLITSAVPLGVTLPNPLSPDLKVDLLPEMIIEPPLPIHYLNDTFCLTSRQLSFIYNSLFSGAEVDISSINEFEISHYGRLHLAIYNFSMKAIIGKAFFDSEVMSQKIVPFYKKMLNFLEAESKYILLLTLSDQLRYPNKHTHYFSCLMLSIFADTTDVYVKELITRVLLGRLIAHKPHPWGVMITFIELVKNARFKFWSYDFTRSTAEIEKMFLAVAKSCMIEQGKR